jgi:hypothetical protein
MHLRSFTSKTSLMSLIILFRCSFSFPSNLILSNIPFEIYELANYCLIPGMVFSSYCASVSLSSVSTMRVCSSLIIVWDAWYSPVSFLCLFSSSGIMLALDSAWSNEFVSSLMSSEFDRVLYSSCRIRSFRPGIVALMFSASNSDPWEFSKFCCQIMTSSLSL